MSSLRKYREVYGLSQDELARRLGVSAVTVGRWETGTRQIGSKSLAVIIKKTGIPIKELRPDLARLLEAAE